MKDFKVILNGKNFHIHSEGSTQILGFYATRFVKADTEMEAQEKAMHLVMNDKKLQSAIRNPSDNAPQIHVDELAQSEITEEDLSQNHVFMFYKGE